MGRKLDLSGLTEHEAEHVLQVVQRDMKLRKTEEERLSDLRQELDAEDSRCRLLSAQSRFNARCCIRCCSAFSFLLNPRRACCGCRFYVCKACRVYRKTDKTWLCTACQKRGLLKTQSLEWFYTNVKKRFKRFGSAKVLKTFYRRHLAEQGALSELTDGSAYEGSVCNEGSICGSDSTFYRQTEEHSMAETLTVALRVAEEAVDEAISKADFEGASQAQQNEALYLREHRAELIEELAKTIVQKIINRRKTLAEMRSGYDHDWLLEHNTDLDHRPHHHQSTNQNSRPLKHQPGLWRSQSAFSLLDNDPPRLTQNPAQAFHKEGGASSVSSWKSVDRLDNAVLKSPDGNWIALQSAQLSRPSLLTQKKSQVYSALERESAVVSAYEGMSSDNETRPEPDSSWGAALQEIHRKMTESTSESSAPLMGRRGSRDSIFSDSEGNWRSNRPLLSHVPAEIRRPSAPRRTSIIDVNFNVEGDEDGESEAEAERAVGRVRRSRRKRKSKKEAPARGLDYNKHDSRCQYSSDAVTPDTLTSGGSTPEPQDLESDIIIGGERGAKQTEPTAKPQQLAGLVSDSSAGEIDVARHTDDEEQSRDKGKKRQGDGGGNETPWRTEMDLNEGKTEDEEEEEVEENEKEEEDDEEEEEEMKYRLYRLVAQARLSYFSSTDDELDRAALSSVGGDGGDVEEGDRGGTAEEKTDGLTYKLCQLEKEVGASRFSSTEDELDRIGVSIGEEQEEDGVEDEDLVVKVCRLAEQVNADQFSSTEDELDRIGVAIGEEQEGSEDSIGVTIREEREKGGLKNEDLKQKVCRLAEQVSAVQFSSTEDELDRTGGGEEDTEEAMWKLQAKRAIMAAQQRDLAGLVNVVDPQFSSSENQLDGVGYEGEMEPKTEWEEDEEVMGKNTRERRQSLEDLDVKMFDLRDETETGWSELDGRAEDIQRGKIEEKKAVCVGDENVLKEGGKAIETEELKKMEFETVAKRMHNTKVQHETKESEGKKWPDQKEQEEERINERKTSPGRWETAAEDSCDEDEFNRIISSMLLMTLEDMQGETFEDKVVDNRKIRVQDRNPEQVKMDEDVEKGGKSGSKTQKKDVGAQDNRDLANEKLVAATIEEMNEDNKGTSQRRTLDNDEQEDMVGDSYDSKETGQRHEETEEEKADQEKGFLSPAEIQMDSDMELYRTIHCLSTLLEQRYSAVSLRSLTTEVLTVLNATEELLHGADLQPSNTSSSLPPSTDHKKLDQQFSRLEENVYVAAGTVYGLEAELGDLEECARNVCSSTPDLELSFLEEQVASAAAKVHQSELQVCDISARIAALKTAGLNVDTQSRLTKTQDVPVMPVTLDSSRQQRRRLPAPPVKEDKEP